MSKPCLYKTIKRNFLNDIECKSFFVTSIELHYGIKPQDEEKFYTISNYNTLFSLLKNNCFSGIALTKHLFSRNRLYNSLFDFKLKYTPQGDYCYYYMKWNEFTHIKVVYEYQEYDIGSFTFKELIDKLPADEFITFCRDNAIDINKEKTNE